MANDFHIRKIRLRSRTSADEKRKMSPFTGDSKHLKSSKSRNAGERPSHVF